MGGELLASGGYRLGRFRQQPFQRPRLARQASRTSWRRLQCHVFAAEVVEREPEREHRLVVRQRLGVGVRQSRESSDVHSAGQVEPFHAARPDFGLRNLTADLFLLGVHYRSRVILLLFLLGWGDKRLHYLGEVAFAIPRLRDDRRVGRKPVRKDRRASGDAGMQTVGED